LSEPDGQCHDRIDVVLASPPSSPLMPLADTGWHRDRGATQLRRQTVTFFLRKRPGDRVDAFDELEADAPGFQIAKRLHFHE
jgi:hypothetical protein